MSERRSRAEIRKGLIELGEKAGSKELEKQVENIYKYDKLTLDAREEEERKAGM
ncbi:MAG: hypothetical protein Q9M28_07705 [Mariprofundaceae bacterium]|nr:hypothetical protein [Mariprofundaceae bacterium]